MVKSYDKAVSELECLRRQLDESDCKSSENKTSVVENIYYNMSNLIASYADFPDTKKAWDDIEDHIKRCELFGNAGEISKQRMEQLSDLYDLINIANGKNEKQGFIYGFNYAMSLIAAGKAVAV